MKQFFKYVLATVVGILCIGVLWSMMAFVMLGVAVASPQASWTRISSDLSHGLVGTTLAQGETFSYCFGSCWSKADIKSAADWFAKVQNL